MRTVETHTTGIVWIRTAKRRKVFIHDSWEWVNAIAVDAMLRLGVVGYRLVGTMAAQLVSVIDPPAKAMNGMITGIIFGASAHFANSVGHIDNCCC